MSAPIPRPAGAPARLAPLFVLLAVAIGAPPASAQVTECQGEPVTADFGATEGDDYIEGTSGPDVIAAGDGNDQIVGFDGDDLICGGPGNDVLYHYDLPEAVSGFTLDIDLEAHTVSGTAGEDEIYEIENVHGSDYDDRVIGDDLSNELYGGEGTDIMGGAGGDDKLYGDSDSDHGFTNPDGPDTMHGDAGNDYMNGRGGSDFIFGDTGRDVMTGEAGNDSFDGGTDFDFVSYACNYTSEFCVDYRAGGTGMTVNTETGTAFPMPGSPPGTDPGVDTLAQPQTEGVFGSDFDDVLIGDPTRADYFEPRLGDDQVDGRGDSSSPRGGDYVGYLCETVTEDPCGGFGGVTVNLATGTSGGAQGADTLTDIRHVVGSEQGDTIIGSGENNELFGQMGGDDIHGGGGDDGIEGESGNDTMDGGAGTDKLRFTLVPCAGRGVDVNLSGGTASGAGSDTIIRGTFEQVIGSPCDDVLSGADGQETLFGSGGADELYGRGGSDLLVPDQAEFKLTDTSAGTNTVDRLFGGAGNDTASYTGAGDSIDVDLGNDIVSDDGDGSHDEVLGIESLIGSPRGDKLSGSSAFNMLLGGAGDDELDGRGDNDYLDGEAGDDTSDGGSGRADFIDFFYEGITVQVNLGQGTAMTLSGFDEVANVEGVGGSQEPDTLAGDRVGNFLFGEGGDDDKIKGSKGNDLLVGGDGSQQQQLLGGKGTDWCLPEGTPKKCESPKKFRKGLKSDFNTVRSNLDGAREFRETGNAQILELNAALDAMRFHKKEVPTG